MTNFSRLISPIKATVFIKAHILQLTLISLFLFLGISNTSAEVNQNKAGRTYHIYPKDSDISGVNIILGFSDWPSFPQPGDVYYLYDSKGPFKESMIIPGVINGTPDEPITFKAALGNSPVIQGHVHFFGSSYILIEGLTITSPGEPAVGIRQGANNIIIKNNTIKDSAIGVWIADNGGMQNRIIDNSIHNNDIFGVTSHLVNCEIGKETVIANNRIYDNGSHGMEINANYYIIERNEVFRNGGGRIGTSGIHISSWEGEGVGRHNIIRYNTIYDNIEIDGPDGNGIQIDHYSDYNEVYYNVSFNNDGAGINIFDGSNNRVYNNTLFGNARRPSTPQIPITKADLHISSDENRNRTNHNEIINNIIMATNPETYALYIDGLTAGRPMVVENNLIFHRQRNNHSFWNYSEIDDIGELNEIGGFENNIYGDPEFQGTTLKRADDFKIKETSPARGEGKFVNLSRDLFGSLLSGNQVDIGAINHSTIERLSPPNNLR